MRAGLRWQPRATPPLMCPYVFATLVGRHHPNCAMPNDKALIVDRQKVELEAKPLPIFVLPRATDLDP